MNTNVHSLKKNIGINDYQSSNVNEYICKLLFYEEEQSDVAAIMGGLSQVQYSLSWDRSMMSNMFDSNIVTHNHYHKEALHIFEEMINSCRSKM